MGVLAPLYLAGLAALSLPLVLHLIRRTPRGRQVFSSLMFLVPSPPRLTRRSRLDQILLLIMRLAALALLAFAFARPFLREAATLAFENLPKRRVAIAVDTSASMRRGDLWQQALREVEKELANLGPRDDVALYALNDHVQTVVGFESPATQAATRGEIVRQALRGLAPTWRATDLGAALTAIAGELDAASDARQLAAELQIVLISDFQKGARIDALQSFEWPAQVRVLPRPLAPRRTTNAHVHLLASEEEAPQALRARVVSAADSSEDQFFIRWAKENEKPSADGEAAVYVPPGQSRVIQLPRPESKLLADRIVLRGDDHEFDNTHYVVPPHKQQVKLLYAGADSPDDQQGPQYYLHLAASGDPLRQVEIRPLEDGDEAALTGDLPQLVVVTRQVSPALAFALRRYADRGGTLLLAPRDQAAAASLVGLLDGALLREDSSPASDYLLLGEIDFGHPLFAPFANPRYSDFTKIHFWKHRRLALRDGAATRVVARFDNGDPAILEKTAPSESRIQNSQFRSPGRTILFASGWNPDDSQLALSSKFVPLISSLLDHACGNGQTLASAVIGQAVPLPTALGPSWKIRKPGGKEVQLAAGATSFTDIDEPGIYRAVSGSQELPFAVNLPAAESNTAPLELEQLEQLGVRFGADLSRAERLARIRQQRDTELESRQKIWRWLILATLGVLVTETWWAGRAARRAAANEAKD